MKHGRIVEPIPPSFLLLRRLLLITRGYGDSASRSRSYRDPRGSRLIRSPSLRQRQRLLVFDFPISNTLPCLRSLFSVSLFRALVSGSRSSDNSSRGSGRGNSRESPRVGCLGEWWESSQTRNRCSDRSRSCSPSIKENESTPFPLNGFAFHGLKNSIINVSAAVHLNIPLFRTDRKQSSFDLQIAARIQISRKEVR